MARTKYTKFYFDPKTLEMSPTLETVEEQTLEIATLGKSKPISFTATFDEETELAGHPTANIVVGVKRREDGTIPKDIDLFVTLRLVDEHEKEVFYTGTAGDPVPLCKGMSSILCPTLSRSTTNNPLLTHSQAGSEPPLEQSILPPLIIASTSHTGSTNRQM